MVINIKIILNGWIDHLRVLVFEKVLTQLINELSLKWFKFGMIQLRHERKNRHVN